MSKITLVEIKKGQTGTGLLIENDGYVSMDLKENKPLMESIRLNESNGRREIPNPFIVSAVFQKYGIENANGRIYPENILRREVDKYMQAIKERRAYGECYTPDALCLSKNGWKPITDIEEGEEILTLNTTTNEIEIQKVTKKLCFDWDDEIFTVKSEMIDDRLTGNHSYPLYDNDKFFDFITVRELQKDKYKNYLIPVSQNADLFEKVENLEFSTDNYNGKVYCVEVPNHTWYVMQNGRSHWTKNCNHPDSTTIDISRIAINIVELHWENQTLVGKLEIPISDGFRNLGIISCCADQVAHWLLSGLRIGVSSRGLGSVEQQYGKLIVGDDYEIVCWDVVSQPSTPNAWIDEHEENLQPFIENKTSNKNIIKEDKFSKFDNWLNG